MHSFILLGGSGGAKILCALAVQASSPYGNARESSTKAALLSTNPESERVFSCGIGCLTPEGAGYIYEGRLRGLSPAEP
jgi:hypothetical protein